MPNIRKSCLSVERRIAKREKIKRRAAKATRLQKEVAELKKQVKTLERKLHGHETKKIHIGPRGGRYYLRDDKKIYI